MKENFLAAVTPRVLLIFIEAPARIKWSECGQ